MESAGVIADKPVEQTSEPAPVPVEQQNNGHEESADSAELDATPSKKAKLDDEPTAEGETTTVKRRSSGRPKKDRDAEMMAEAKAAFGELDTSGGRSMRKRPDPPKVEPKKPVVRRSNSKKSPAKAEDKTEKMEEDSEEAKEESKVDKKKTAAAVEKSTEEEKDKTTDAAKETEVKKTDDAVVPEVTTDAASTSVKGGSGDSATTTDKTDVAPTEATAETSKVGEEQKENGENEKKEEVAAETNGVPAAAVGSSE